MAVHAEGLECEADPAQNLQTEAVVALGGCHCTPPSRSEPTLPLNFSAIDRQDLSGKDLERAPIGEVMRSIGRPI